MLSVNGKILYEVECFKYLGCMVTVDSKLETEVKSRMNEVQKVLEGIIRLAGIEKSKR